MEGMSEKGKKGKNKKKWLGRLSPSPFFLLTSLSRSFLTDTGVLYVCASGQARGCLKASVQKAQINPTAYVSRHYHVC